MPSSFCFSFRLSTALIVIALCGPSCKSDPSENQSSKQINGDLNIRVVAAPISRPSAMPVTVDRALCGESKVPLPLIQSSSGELGSAVIWLEGATLQGWPEEIKEETVVRFKNCEIEPRVILTPLRGLVRFESEDPILHSIRTISQMNYPLFRTLPPQQRDFTLRFENSEMINVTSDLHPWIKAVIIVTPHRFYAVSNSKGIVQFSKVPLGSYQVKGWHPLLGFSQLNTPAQVTQGNTDITFNWEKPEN